MKGVISVVTDGTTGGKIKIENSRVVVDNILTRYQDENGDVSDSIPEDISIDEEAKTDITISSGYVTINKIETLSDYYIKEESEVTLFSKAKINIFSADAQDSTKIENPHDTEDYKIDTAIQTIINTTEDPEVPVDHEVVHTFDSEHTFAAVEPTCTEDGHILYYQCTFCYEYFDEKGNEITDINQTVANGGTLIPALGHSLVHYAAVEPTCTETGNIEYWYCSRCGEFFTGEEATTGITQSETIISDLGHNWGDWTEDNEETHSRTCSRCGETETESHNFTDWTETEDGYERHCEDCGRTETRDFDHVHELVHVSRVEPGCTTTGTIEHWYCAICKEYFSDEAATTEVTEEDLIIPATGHTLVLIEATEPTCEGYGNVEYWVCSVCGDYFRDQNGTEALTAEDLTKTTEEGGILISPTGHSAKTGYEYDTEYHWHVCEHDETHILDKEEHTWDEGQFIDNGQHFVYTCTVCGAKYSISEPEYNEYNIGIGTLLVPTGVIPAPSGDMVITREGNVCTVKYVPHLNSPTDYKISCRYMYNGRWTDLVGTSDTFTVTLKGVLAYKIQMQIYNDGGTIVRQQTVYKNE